MNAAIPRLCAQEWMDSYTIQVVANPYADKQSRENILGAWRKLIVGTWDHVTRGTSSDERLDESRRYDTDGTEIIRRVGLPLREIHRMILNAFGRGIKSD